MNGRRPHVGLRIMGWIGVCLGVAVLIGWAFDLTILKRIFPGLISMKPNTTLGILAIGIGLLGLRRFPLLTRACAVFVGALAFLTLIEIFFGWNFGIDELLFKDRDPAFTEAIPGRMAFTTTICLALSAAVLWLLGTRKPGARQPFVLGWLGSMIFSMGLFSGLASWTGFAEGYVWEMWTSMSLHAALFFMALGSALLWKAWSESAAYWRTTSWLTAGFVLGVVILAFVAVGFNANNRELIRSATHLVQTQNKLRALDQFLAAFENLERAWHRLFNQGQSLTGDQPAQLERPLGALKALDLSVSQIKILKDMESDSRSAAAILTTPAPTNPSARQSVLEETDRIHRRIHANAMLFRETEIMALGQHSEQSQASAKNASFLLPLSTFLSLVLLTSAFFLLNSEISGRQHALEALRESEERFRTMAHLMPQLAWSADAHGSIYWYNQRFCDYTGLSQDEILRQGWPSLIEPSYLEQVMHKWEESVRQGTPFESEVALRAADGSYRRFLGLAMPLKDEKGRILRWFGTDTDVEESKRIMSELERKEVQLRLSQQVGRVGGFDWDLLTNEVEWSPELEVLYGLPPGAFGRTYEAWASHVHPGDRPEAEKRAQDAVQSGLFLAEFRVIWPDKSVHWIGGRGSVIRDSHGKPIRLVGVNYDITEMKQAEERVRSQNVELEKRVNERTAQLQAANKELESFSYSVSHDLRAPLRALDGFSRMLIERYTQQLDVDGQRMLGILRSESQRMAQLIDDLLAFSRLGRQPVEFKPVDMQALAQTAMDEVMGRNAGRKVELRIEPLPEAFGEQPMLRQVWVNLLDNALKFTRKSDPARITLGAQAQAHEQIYFVKDNGVGFDMRYVGKLFDVFQRLHSDKEFAGTGVGLALVKRVIQRHGGRVWAEGEIGKGATFYFALPLKS